MPSSTENAPLVETSAMLTRQSKGPDPAGQRATSRLRPPPLAHGMIRCSPRAQDRAGHKSSARAIGTPGR